MKIPLLKGRDAAALRAETLEYMKSQTVAALATVNAAGKPGAALVHFVVDDQFQVWFVTRRHTRKFESLRDNANVAMVVGVAEKAKTVQLTGRARMCGDKLVQEFNMVAARNPGAFKVYFGGSNGESPFHDIPGIDVAVFRVTVSHVQLMDLNLKTKEATFRAFTP